MIDPVDEDPAAQRGEPFANPAGGAEKHLVYVPNPKHKEPWQRGRRGSVCPTEITPEQAQQLLNDSELVDQKRYSVHEEGHFAQDDGSGGWHGYPVGWKGVPSKLRTRWQKRENRVRKRDIDRYWEG